MIEQVVQTSMKPRLFAAAIHADAIGHRGAHRASIKPRFLTADGVGLVHAEHATQHTLQ